MTGALALAADRLEGVPGPAEQARERSLDDHPGPLDLMCALNPSMVRTPALELLSADLEHAITTPGARLIVSLPPQEGKSNSLRYAVLRALQHNPDCRVAWTSYAADLARVSSLAVRQMVETFGSGVRDDSTGVDLADRLGLAIAPDEGAASGWRLRGHLGGMLARGVGSGLTGRPVDLLVCDDPIKDERDADSALIRSRLHNWWTSVSETRLAPTASVIVVQTRWHEDDLAGWLIRHDEELPEHQREWRVINIPALSDGKTADALNRPAGEWLESARKRSDEEWQKIRRRVGERVFAALYQGRPAPLAGGVFNQEWFDRDRVEVAPDATQTIVYVDPADNTGGGDEAGVLVGRRGVDGRIYLGPDLTSIFTTGRWVRVALLACVEHEAATLAYEQSLSGLARAVKTGWENLRKQARVMHRLHTGGWFPLPDETTIAATMAELSHPEDPDDTITALRAELVELWPHVPAVLEFPEAGPRIRVLKPKGSKLFRAQTAAPMVETRKVSLVGRMPELEHQCVTWQPGQASPGRLDCVAYAIHDLANASAATLTRSRDTIPTRSVGGSTPVTPQRPRRARPGTTGIARSTRR